MKKKLSDGTSVHSFQTLLSEMSTIVCNEVQRKALELVGLKQLSKRRQK